MIQKCFLVTGSIVAGVATVTSSLVAPASAGVTSGRVPLSFDAPLTRVQLAPSYPDAQLLPNKTPVPGDDSTPLLTPDIRPKVPAPNARPEVPERKSEPNKPDSKQSSPQVVPTPPGPQQKDATPRSNPGDKPTQRSEPSPRPPSTNDGKSAKKAPPPKPGLAVAQPRTAAEREKALTDLYAHLAAAEDAKQAASVSGSIEKLWVTSGSDTVAYLMQRAMQAANAKNPQLALQLLDAVVALAPDYAEGWNRRAYVHYTQNSIDQALGDLRRTLALDPNHFKALDGLILILKDIGRKKEALQATRRLLDINPYYEGAQQIVDELSREIEGRGI